jgi:hypothetical protein
MSTREVSAILSHLSSSQAEARQRKRVVWRSDVFGEVDDRSDARARHPGGTQPGSMISHGDGFRLSPE